MVPSSGGYFSKAYLPISFSTLYSYSDAGEDYPLKSVAGIDIISATYSGSYHPNAYFIFIGV